MAKNIFAISGSLRSGSFNTALLKQMEAHLGDKAQFTYADIGSIPHYNSDLEEKGEPESVTVFKDAIAAADAVIVATPEYNYSIPGVLKNALDWASRPGFNSVMKGKSFGIVSASMAGTGGVRAQLHLRTILAGVLADIIPTPDVQVAAAHKIVAEDGSITDETTLKYLGRLAETLIA